MGSDKSGDIESVYGSLYSTEPAEPAPGDRVYDDVPNNQKESTLARRGLVAAAALLFGLGFGLNFGASNENTYLVGGLRLLGRGLLAHDWLATQTTPYHQVFAYPAALLLYLDSSGWLFAIVNVLFLALGAVIVYKLVRIIVEPAQQLLVLVLVLLLAVATRTLSVADSTLYTLELEPATLGVTGFLGGMYLFARGRYLLSGLALAAGGIFHANYLLLAFPVFLIAHLILRRHGALRPLLRQFTFPALALLALLPVIVPIAFQPGSVGTDILLAIRSPHHYEPPAFRDEFVPFLGWLLLLGASLRREEVGRGEGAGPGGWSAAGAGFSPTVALAAAMTLLIVAASALTSFVYVPSVAQIYVWRLAPLVVVLCQIFAMRMVAGAVDARAAESRWLLPTVWRIGLVTAAGECFVYYYYLQHRDRLALEVLGGILVLGLAAWALRRRQATAGSVATAAAGSPAAHARTEEAVGPPGAAEAGADATEMGFISAIARPARITAVAVVIAIASGCLVWVAGNGLNQHSNLLAAPTAESRLYSWARTTDPGAVFLIPPDLDGFRLASERAVVVDWKSTPFAPSELEEWYRRIDAISGRTLPKTAAQAARAYAKLPAPRLKNLADMYAATYVVRREPVAAAPPASWRLVYDNGEYEVLQTDAAPIAAGQVPTA